MEEQQETGSNTVLRRSKRAFGLCLSAVLVLAACSSKEHPFGAAAATGGTGESGGSSGGGAGGEGGLGAAGAGTGGGDPGDCETDDPHCACVDGDVVARDEDEDGAGSSLCAAAPGEDCNDTNGEFVQDACGGCNEDFVGLAEGDACGPGASAASNCGVVTCDGDVVSCETPTPELRRCADATTRELCQDAQWVAQPECESSYSICHDGLCVECVPGTYQCDTHYFGSASSSSAYTTVFCGPTGSWESTHTSCSGSEICTTSSGCTSLFHPRDADFEVVPLLAPQGGSGEGSGRPVRDVLDLAVGIDFG